MDSFKNLSPDENGRTNQLLANLTEIIIKINGVNTTALAVAQPFVPDSSDVRVNVYWCLSLIFSVCLNMTAFR